VLPLSCPYGVIGEIVDYGVNDIAADFNDTAGSPKIDSQMCLNVPLVNEPCKPNNPEIEPALNKAIGQ